MRTTALFIAMAMFVAAPALAQTEEEEDAPPRTLTDPAEALPSRQTGEAVLSGREAFDRAAPQFQIGRRGNANAEAEAAAAAGAQLTGSNQTLSHECEVGERVELVGDTNIATITGQCVGISISGNGNQVTIDTVDEIRIQGENNDVRWSRGFTVDRPNTLETGGRNSVQQLAVAD
jgi:hypothetical protein